MLFYIMASPFVGQDVVYLAFNLLTVPILILIAWLLIFIMYTVLFLYTGANSSIQKRNFARWLIISMTVISSISALGIVSYASSAWTALLAALFYGYIIWLTTANSLHIIENDTIDTFNETFRSVLPISITVILSSLFGFMERMADK